MNNFLWNRETGDIYGESLLFTGAGSALLAFPARRIEAVRNAVSGEIYREGEDFSWVPGGRDLRRTPESKIPFLGDDFLYPDPAVTVLYPGKGARGINLASGSPTGHIAFDGQDYFQRHQVEVDYATDAALPELEAAPAGKLPRFRTAKHLELLFIGDSITDGWNATGKVGVAPNQPPWPGLVAEKLGGCRVKNSAVSGSGSNSAAEHLRGALTDIAPSLIFIAYGMNDLSRLAPEEFRKNIEAAIAAGTELAPGAEFVLISQMQGNPQWDLTPPGKAELFARELREIAAASPHVLYVPLCELWRLLTDNKKFLDTTGNGVNHPNDYGHRIYAAAVMAMLR